MTFIQGYFENTNNLAKLYYKQNKQQLCCMTFTKPHKLTKNKFCKFLLYYVTNLYLVVNLNIKIGVRDYSLRLLSGRRYFRAPLFLLQPHRYSPGNILPSKIPRPTNIKFLLTLVHSLLYIVCKFIKINNLFRVLNTSLPELCIGETIDLL